jgi:ornithine carbamoyltransferase
MKHFLKNTDFSKAELLKVLALAEELKAKKKAGEATPLLAGKTLAMIFEHPSNRTRVSFEVGMFQLGGAAINIKPSELQIGKRETIADVSRVFSRFVDGVMIRARKHSDIAEFAEYSAVPVINGLSDSFHPCQAVADILTIKERMSLDSAKVCYVGDGNNVCNSLIEICELLDIEIRVACPKGYEPSLGKEYSKCLITNDVSDAVSGANVIYTDVWTSMGQEEENEKRRQIFKDYAVTSKLMSSATSDAIFMHCLPAHRGEEVSAEVMESKGSVVFDQAENRLHAQKAILVNLLK